MSSQGAKFDNHSAAASSRATSGAPHRRIFSSASSVPRDAARQPACALAGGVLVGLAAFAGPAKAQSYEAPGSNAIIPAGVRSAIAIGGTFGGASFAARAQRDYDIAIGHRAFAIGDSVGGALALGQQSAANGAFAMAIGTLATAQGLAATAIGPNNQAIGDGSTAVGQSFATATAAAAIGYLAEANAANAIATGAFSKASGASAAAYGPGATATQTNAIALGQNAQAVVANSVALGSNAVTAVRNIGPYSINGGVIAATASAGGTVSVGSAGAERQIQNVAAGVVSATSTDAVNGSQLFAAATATNTAATGAANAFGGGANWDSATGTWTGPTFHVRGNSYNNVADALGAVNTNIANINTTINNLSVSVAGGLSAAYQQTQGVQREARQGIALAVAIPTAHMPSAPGKTTITASSGTYKGYGAMGGAIMHRLDTKIPVAIGASGSLGMRNSYALRGEITAEF